MPNKSKNFKLEYFKQGSYYSAGSDMRRFLTLDYNLESYVGIIGVGVISGWEMEQVSGLNIQILPGQGIINGYFAESPYVVKKRSEMNIPDHEIEVLNENDVPQPNLSVSQRAHYVSVIQDYDPLFNPVGDIENAYVKVVDPYQMTLDDNEDNYIYIEFRITSGGKYYPYPALNDYPPPAGLPPQRTNYNTYNSYKVALDAYNAKLVAIHNYEWYTNPDNHFTEVSFVKTHSYTVTSSKVLIGKIVTRDGSVSKIDTSAVSKLANMQSQIQKYATEFLKEHHHGGSQSFDPPKVRLETDIRNTVLYDYNVSNGRAIYMVMDKNQTSITLGHKHSYVVDSNGDGQTFVLIGSGTPHFHKISTYIVGNQEYSTNSMESHIHTILETADTSDTWTNDSPYNIYVNNNLFGDKSTSFISADSTTGLITFDKGISSSQNKYYVSFTVALVDYQTGATVNKDYSYEATDVSVYHFMLTMINDYNNTFFDYYNEQVIDASTGATNSAYTDANLATHPFQFTDSSGNIVGLSDLKNQSAAAQSILNKVEEQFTFTPNAARNISITLIELGYTDEVQIEILGNVEVTGKLSVDNILYLNANKILTGEFIPQVIPFISHAGRINEEFLPLQNAMVSNDGIRYQVVPTVTDMSLGHAHELLLDSSYDGITTNLLIANQPVYYGDDNNGNSYFIYHSHSVLDNNVSSSQSTGLLNWQNNVASANLTSSEHIHNVIVPITGNDKIVYSIKEDAYGNIYTGTSNGFMIIPSLPAYLFVINGKQLYFYGNDLWTLFGMAKAEYEAETGNSFYLLDSYKQEINDADLSEVGSSILLTGTAYPDRPLDQTMIQRVSSFNMPNFKYVETKNASQVLPTETVISTNTTANTVIVERDFNDVPVWSIAINSPDNNFSLGSSSSTSSSSESSGSSSSSSLDSRSSESLSLSSESEVITTDLFVVGSNIIAKNVAVNETPYQPWKNINTPFFINVIRKIIRDYAGNSWVCTNNGILVSRAFNQGDIFEAATLPGSYPDIADIVEGEEGAVYCASSAGIFKTEDGGKSWNKKFDVTGGFKQIVRDWSDTSDIVLYAVDNSKKIWMSTGNGNTWTEYGLLPQNECGDVFAAFDAIFVSQSDGIYKSANGLVWTKVLSEKAYCYEWSYDKSSFYVGCDNVIYASDGSTFVEIYRFIGSPSPILIQNGSRKSFGYAYSNLSNTFHFKSFVSSSDEIAALVDFTRWYAQNGAWKTTEAYDIYINYKRVLSTKHNEDKRSVYDYYFTVNPTDGLIDFSAFANVNTAIKIYDSTILVDSTKEFYDGDSIIINGFSNAAPVSVYGIISSVGSDEMILTSNVSQNVDLPATVKKIPNLNGDSNVSANIYNSLLSNIGILTHDQVEDGLSEYSDGRPYKFNDTYLSNLLELTQAVRYVYPSINSEMINDVFYDFRYYSPAHPTYPPITDYIDVLTSDTYSQKIYDNNFIGKWAKSINKILIGYGKFYGTIIVATDVGIFWAKLEDNYEANWFYVTELPYAVYDLIIFSGQDQSIEPDTSSSSESSQSSQSSESSSSSSSSSENDFSSNKLIAATANGTYYTSDMQNWTLESVPAMAYPSYSLGLRWLEQNDVVVTNSSANFDPNPLTNTIVIKAYSGTPYLVFADNRGVKISIDGEDIGNFVLESIGDAGGYLGTSITVSPYLDISGIQNNVVITMGSWWGQWNGDVNQFNPSITNTLLVGGANHISYNNGGSVWAWYESSYGNISNFISRKFLPLSSGRLLLAATGSSTVFPVNYLLKSDDIGNTWSVFRQFREVAGNIIKAELSDFNNSILTVNYVSPKDLVTMDAQFDQQDIAIFDKNSALLFRGKVIGNQDVDSEAQITVYGNIVDLVISGDCKFVIYPLKVNTMVQTNANSLMYGTDCGLYYDANTVVSNDYPQGSVVSVNINGTVSKIDVSGKIVSVTSNVFNNTSSLVVTADTNIRADTLINSSIYITDTNPVEKYTIIGNDSITPGEQSNLKVGAIIPLSYIGKKFRIVGDKSRVYIDFDLPVLTNQFKGGSLLITSSGYNNVGEAYTISTNTDTYVDLDSALIPISTLAPRNVIEATTTTTTTTSTTTSKVTPLQLGQSVRLFDSSGKVVLWGTFDRPLKENSLVGMGLELTNIPASRDIGEVSILSNLENSVTVNVSSSNSTSFITGDSFEIIGNIFEKMGGFSHLETSVESDHYHNVETVNGIVSGLIESFSNVDPSYVTFNVINTTSNFYSSIVEYSNDLFEDAQIIFTNTTDINVRYVSEVVSSNSYANTITVRLKDASYWSFLNVSFAKISTGWNWQIDGTNYGYTNGTLYSDFEVLGTAVNATAVVGSNSVSVVSTTGINVGDKIMIQDDTLSSEIHYVQNNTNPLQLTTVLGRTFFADRSPQIKVLRDTFTNTHKHQIRNNEVQVLSETDYLDLGYPPEHSHMVLPLLSEVSVLLNNGNTVVAMGSGSIIYASDNNGTIWYEISDLNNYLEGAEEVNGISAGVFNDGVLIVGATNGSLFVESKNNNQIISLRNPL